MRSSTQHPLGHGIALLHPQRAADCCRVVDCCRAVITPSCKALPEAIPLDVVYEDADVLVVNKVSEAVQRAGFEALTVPLLS